MAPDIDNAEVDDIEVDNPEVNDIEIDNVEIDENSLPLSEFIKLPTTIDFNIINSRRFRDYAATRPYLKMGEQTTAGNIVVYTNIENLEMTFNDFGQDFVSFFPIILSPLDQQVNYEAGIIQVVNQPYLSLTGRGVIIGFVDTGIDYTKDSFKFEDGSSKILRLWDQTIDGKRTPDVNYGSVYTQEDITEALKAEMPYEIVPSIDEDGHGTFLASVAAGNDLAELTGAAPKSYIMAVKLRRAHEFYIDRFLLPKDNPNLYQSTDFLLGMDFIVNAAAEMGMPAVICIAMGSNMSGHNGNTPLEEYITFISQRIGYAFVTAAGNESNARHHTQGVLQGTGGTDNISIRVGAANTSFTVSIFGEPYDKFSVGITSPTGEVVARQPYRSGYTYTERLIFEKTIITINYFKDLNIVIGFRNATPGIWEINLFGDAIVSGNYFAWLPITGQVSPQTEFLRSVPEYTIVFPATSLRSIVCGAYDHSDNSLFVSSSWGPTRLPRMAPDFVAPGVNVRGVFPSGVGNMTGTSVSAAIAAGASAMLLEWGIVRENIRSMDGDLVRTLLISGSVREEGMIYPNNKWGYGKLNLLGTFLSIRESALEYNLS